MDRKKYFVNILCRIISNTLRLKSQIYVIIFIDIQGCYGKGNILSKSLYKHCMYGVIQSLHIWNSFCLLCLSLIHCQKCLMSAKVTYIYTFLHIYDEHKYLAHSFISLHFHIFFILSLCSIVIFQVSTLQSIYLNISNQQRSTAHSNIV